MARLVAILKMAYVN